MIVERVCGKNFKYSFLLLTLFELFPNRNDATIKYFGLN